METKSTHRVAIAALSGAYSIMMDKSAQHPGGARPSPFTISTITYKVVVYASPISTLPYMYSVLELVLVSSEKDDLWQHFLEMSSMDSSSSLNVGQSLRL